MADIYLTNSLSRKKEKFEPLDPQNVGMYTCGPTVYQYAHIGNLRTYTVADILNRLLGYNSYLVRYVMNITDVGHLTGDNLGDADLGSDRMEESAKKEGKTAWDIAKFYTDAFLADMDRLNIRRPWMMPKATDHIQEQIALIKRIEEKGIAYKTSDGIYFDTVQYEKVTHNIYGELSTLDQIKAGARVEENPEKKDPRDFALWKFSEKPGDRQMEWESPWGLGFPGWHIECSAMSMKYLGESFDIHVGGEDLRSTHHPNEIAQSEAATGKPFVKYWIHSAFLQVDGARMSKSKGNAYLVMDIIDKGYDPLALRYLYLSGHYRDPINFTWQSLDGAQKTLNNMRELVRAAKNQSQRTTLSTEKAEGMEKFRDDFTMAINDDLNTPKALAAFWSMLKSNLPSPDKYEMALSFDEVLGLKLGEVASIEVPENVMKLVGEREQERKNGDFKKSDEVRAEIEKLGYTVLDTSEGPQVKSNQ
jgi:cysteinyl-tRNA synthetase